MAAANGFGLSAIGQIAVNAHDINRAIDFYRDKLGMKFLFTAPPGLAFFDCDGIRHRHHRSPTVAASPAGRDPKWAKRPLSPRRH